MRERDWANAITAHEGDHRAYTWKLRDYSIGEHVLTVPANKMKGYPGNVTSVCLSHCGNFGFVGTSIGRMDKYNMQSGIHRFDYHRVFKSKGILLSRMHGLQFAAIAACGQNNEYTIYLLLDHVRIRMF